MVLSRVMRKYNSVTYEVVLSRVMRKYNSVTYEVG